MILRKVFKIGNTLAVTLPKAMVDEAGIRRGDQVAMEVRNKVISLMRCDEETFALAKQAMRALGISKKKGRR